MMEKTNVLNRRKALLLCLAMGVATTLFGQETEWSGADGDETPWTLEEQAFAAPADESEALQPESDVATDDAIFESDMQEFLSDPDAPAETPVPEAEASEPEPAIAPPEDIDDDQSLLDFLRDLDEVTTPQAPAIVAPSPAAIDDFDLEPPATVPAALDAAAVVERGETSEDQQALLIAMQEEIRRQALEIEARRRIMEARQAMAREDYPQALRLFEAGLQRMPLRPDTEALLQTLQRERVEALYFVLLEQVRTGSREQVAQARDRAQAALQIAPEHRGLQRLTTAADRRIEQLAPPPPRPDWDSEEVQARRQRVRNLLLDARGFLRSLDLDRAQELFETVLSIEPDNPEAMRYLQELHTQRYQLSSLEREAAKQSMMADVRDTWRPREYREVERDVSIAPTTTPTHEALILQMERIVIPEIEFRQANIHDVVEFLVRASMEGDPSPEKRGVNIILNLQSSGPAAAAPAASDPWAAQMAGPAAVAGTDITVTFTARHISLLQALKIITQVAGLKYHIEENIVLIVPADAVIDRIIHRMYPVEPSLIDLVERERATAPTGADPFMRTMGTGGVDRERPPVQQFFEQMGVPFPPGSSVAYRSSIGKLVVANTAENLVLFERILGELNVVPNQVEIEARFVEINQTDLEEFGLQWLLEDNWQVLQKRNQGNVPLAARERIEVQGNAAGGGFTRGLRFANPSGELPVGGGQGTLGSIMTISSVLTNPEFSLVINALAQKGHADVLSAPKVTTRAGQEANIRVVTEYIYPTAYEIREITGTVDGQQVVLDAFTIPSAFETREVGVILSVLPEVSPDGNMINLTLRPEVTDEPIWRNYGAVIRRADGSEQQTNMEQPFFPTRTLTTQISIYDGATVVMGGLITEHIVSADDKIPFLGDLPLLGRLFRSTSKQSSKRNLLIFVTARLVDPAGRPVRAPRAETVSASLGPDGISAR